MPPAPCSRVPNWDFAWASVFVRSSWSSAQFASVIVSTGYRLLLTFFFKNVKPSSFIRSIDIQNTLSRQSINNYSFNVSPCKTLVTMSKKLVSLLDKWTITFMFSKSIIMAVTFSFGRRYASNIYSVFSLCMESISGRIEKQGIIKLNSTNNVCDSFWSWGRISWWKEECSILSITLMGFATQCCIIEQVIIIIIIWNASDCFSTILHQLSISFWLA